MNVKEHKENAKENYGIDFWEKQLGQKGDIKLDKIQTQSALLVFEKLHGNFDILTSSWCDRH